MKITGYEKKCLNCGINFKDTSKRALCLKCYKISKETRLQEKVTTHKLEGGKLPYKFGIFVLSKNTLSEFVFLNNRRKISESNVNSLAGALKNGVHFDSPIVVSSYDKLFYVIDGNHRIEAFKNILKKHPDFKLEVLLIVYGKLEEDDRIQVFRRWNVGRPQSTDDFIQSVAHKVPIIRWMKNDFPLSLGVYKQPGTIHVRPLLNGYLAAKRSDEMAHGFNKSKFATALQDLDVKDYEFLKLFVSKFVEIFGEPSGKNPYYRTSFLGASLYLAWEYENAELMYKAFADRVRGDEEIISMSKLGGREANKQMIQKMRDRVKLKPKLRVD